MCYFQEPTPSWGWLFSVAKYTLEWYKLNFLQRNNSIMITTRCIPWNAELPRYETAVGMVTANRLLHPVIQYLKNGRKHHHFFLVPWNALLPINDTEVGMVIALRALQSE